VTATVEGNVIGGSWSGLMWSGMLRLYPKWEGQIGGKVWAPDYLRQGWVGTWQSSRAGS
jgi:hypothetical protein